MSKIKVTIKSEGETIVDQTYPSFKAFKKNCIVNGANLDPKKCFDKFIKPSVCVNFFTDTGKCLRKHCPFLRDFEDTKTYKKISIGIDAS